LQVDCRIPKLDLPMELRSCIYRTYFTPGEAEARYSNMSETDLIYRCLGIILESIAFTGDQIALDDTKVQSSNASKAKG
jgi:hypothetical protein